MFKITFRVDYVPESTFTIDLNNFYDEMSRYERSGYAKIDYSELKIPNMEILSFNFDNSHINRYIYNNLKEDFIFLSEVADLIEDFGFLSPNNQRKALAISEAYDKPLITAVYDSNFNNYELYHSETPVDTIGRSMIKRRYEEEYGKLKNIEILDFFDYEGLIKKLLEDSVIKETSYGILLIHKEMEEREEEKKEKRPYEPRPMDKYDM